MRFYSIVLLSATALVACVDSASTATGSKMTPVGFPGKLRSFTDSPSGTPTKRMLRTPETTDEDEEERVPGLEKLTGLAKKMFVEPSTVRVWLMQKKTGADVLNQLKLGGDALTALKSSKMNILAKYITKFNEKNPNKQISLIGTLAAHYGDDAMAQALVTARKSNDKIAKDIATKLSTQQLEHWINSEKSVDDVFTLLKLRDDGFRALYSRKLETLDDYIKFFNREKTSQESLLKTLTTGFGGEDKLVSILATAKTHFVAMNKAMELEGALVRKWGNEKLRPVSVLRRLNLYNDVKALSSPKLKTVIKYIPEFNKKNPSDEFSLLGTFTTRYGDDIVAKALVSAKQVDGMYAIATKLQTQQLQGWLNSGKSVDDVFTLLKLGDNGVQSLVSRKLETLDEYIKLFNSKNPQEKTNLFRVLRTGSSGDGDFAILVSRMMGDVPSSSAVYLNAEKYQIELFQKWETNNINPADVLNEVFVKVGKNNKALVESIIKQYKMFYNIENGLDNYPFVYPRRT